MRHVLMAMLAVLVVAGAIALATAGDGEPETATGNATAPIAPRGVPAATPCVTDEPGEGAEIEEARRVQLPTPDPARWRPGTPERAVAEFMDAWRDRAWDRMAMWAAPSWQEVTPGDEGALLRERYGAYRLRGWSFGEGRESDPRSVRLEVLVAHRDLAPRIERERLQFVVNRENADGELVESGGRWGVFLSEKPDAPVDCPAG